MNECLKLDCIHNNRLTTPRCKRPGGPKIDEDVLCSPYKVDFDYRRIEDRERYLMKPWNEENSGKIHHD